MLGCVTSGHAGCNPTLAGTELSKVLLTGCSKTLADLSNLTQALSDVS